MFRRCAVSQHEGSNTPVLYSLSTVLARGYRNIKKALAMFDLFNKSLATSVRGVNTI
jgi:hypothetical protein